MTPLIAKEHEILRRTYNVVDCCGIRLVRDVIDTAAQGEAVAGQRESAFDVNVQVEVEGVAAGVDAAIVRGACTESGGGAQSDQVQCSVLLLLLSVGGRPSRPAIYGLHRILRSVRGSPRHGPKIASDNGSYRVARRKTSRSHGNLIHNSRPSTDSCRKMAERGSGSDRRPRWCGCRDRSRRYLRSRTYRALRATCRCQSSDHPGRLHRWRWRDTAAGSRCTGRRTRAVHSPPILRAHPAAARRPSSADRDRTAGSSDRATRPPPWQAELAQRTAGSPYPRASSQPQPPSPVPRSRDPRGGPTGSTGS